MCHMRFWYLLVFLILCFEVQNGASYRTHRSHSVDRHYKAHHHTSTLTKVMMPSGTSYLIKTPTLSKKWDCDKKPKLIQLTPEGKMSKKEYEIVKKEMETTWGADWTSSNHQIIKIEKIISTCLWNRYKFRRSQVVEEAKDAHEQFLFHGTTKTDDIIQKGFDERFSRISGYFGAGLYFANDPKKSNAYTSALADGSKQLLLCRVALGNMNIVQSSIKVAHAPVGFHSVKGDITQPEFVIYRGEQAYPEYVITYK